MTFSSNKCWFTPTGGGRGGGGAAATGGRSAEKYTKCIENVLKCITAWSTAVYTKEAKIFEISMSHLKILGASRVGDLKQAPYQGPTILCATIQNSVGRATQCTELMHS
jgi:hypothetical protein